MWPLQLSSIGTKLLSRGMRYVYLVACVLLASWLLYSWHTNAVTTGYNAGYEAAVKDSQLSTMKEFVQDAKSVRDGKEKISERYKEVPRVVREVTIAASSISVTCDAVDSSTIELLNEPIRASNNAMRVH